MSTMINLTNHYVGIAELIGLTEVRVDLEAGFVLALVGDHQVAIDLYPVDPAYLRVLTRAPLPAPADPWLVAHDVTTGMKMVKALVADEYIELAFETLADPSAGPHLPDIDTAAAALGRVVDTLLAAIDHIYIAGQLAGIQAATLGMAGGDGSIDLFAEPYVQAAPGTAFRDPQSEDIFVACPSRGQHAALIECWMCWADVHSGRIPTGAALGRITPDEAVSTTPASDHDQA